MAWKYLSTLQIWQGANVDTVCVSVLVLVYSVRDKFGHCNMYVYKYMEGRTGFFVMDLDVILTELPAAVPLSTRELDKALKAGPTTQSLRGINIASRNGTPALHRGPTTQSLKGSRIGSCGTPALRRAH